ncbi:NUDIX domain-containing protein [Plantactinospora sp. BB1]|uniref:NUDIX domain-containing protein n=1 Tax=Plantactinospora sp. BB1 TaxID=2071627 RepID=UPI000D167B84|nr:NUDIX domain-containing protein [Plantactinospora sp. BB1]AVT37206.1 NUDIX hydrolase [Plantactinospora sp. BB1]
MTGVPHSHCSYCGTAYSVLTWPRVCAHCGQTTWRNPSPVALAILPVLTADGIGVVVQRRDIEPGRGRLALPGGFIDYGEDWRDALVRELREETGLVADARTAELYAVHSAPAGGTILIFGVLPARPADSLPPSAPTEEATEWLVLTEPAELAFATHTQVLAEFLAANRPSGPADPLPPLAGD